MSEALREIRGEYAGTADLSESDLYRLLSVERRRVALDVLAERTAPVEVEDLAATVARRESAVEGGDEETIQRVALTLHHMHLPKMADLGVVEYHPEGTRVESCPRRPDV